MFIKVLVFVWSMYNLRIRLEHRYDNRFKIAEDLIDPSNAILMDNDGNEVQPVPQMNDDGESVDWRQEWEGSTEMVAHFNLDSDNEYTLHTGTEMDSEFEVMPYDSRDEENCGSDDELSEELEDVGDRSPAPMTMSDTHSTAPRDRQIRPLPDVSQRADAIGRWDEACPVL